MSVDFYTSGTTDNGQILVDTEKYTRLQKQLKDMADLVILLSAPFRSCNCGQNSLSVWHMIGDSHGCKYSNVLKKARELCK